MSFIVLELDSLLIKMNNIKEKSKKGKKEIAVRRE